LLATINSRATSAARLGVGLAVLDRDLDRKGFVADLEAAAHRVQKVRDHEVVGLGESGERACLRADIAEFQGPGGAHRRREDRERRAAGDRALDQSAAVNRGFLTDHGKPPLLSAPNVPELVRAGVSDFN